MTAPPNFRDSDEALPQFYSAATKGAASELIACAHLMRRGWCVYRCESPHAPFDLVAYRRDAGTLLRVEVKSAFWSAEFLGAGISLSWPTNDEWDLLIVVDTNKATCIEITTHNQLDGRNQVRAHYGLPPLAPLFGEARNAVQAVFEAGSDVEWTPRTLAAATGFAEKSIRNAVDALYDAELVDRVRPGVYRASVATGGPS